MRVSSDYFEDFDDAGLRGSRRLQRMIDEQRHRVKRLKARSAFGPGVEWTDEWNGDAEYSDYNEEKFDSYSITR